MKIIERSKGYVNSYKLYFFWDCPFEIDTNGELNVITL